MSDIIKKIKELILKYKQFILFCMVGVSNTLVALIVNFILIKIFGLTGLTLVLAGFDILAGAASIAGDIAGAVNSYILNSKFVFSGRNKSTGPRFIIAFIIYAALSAVLIMLINKILGIPRDYCKIIVTPVMLILNFIMNKLWVFKNEK